MKPAKGEITFKGKPLSLAGTMPAVGDVAPDATVLKEVRLSDFAGTLRVIVSVPSLDTPVCDRETRRFNAEAGRLGDGVRVLVVSMDLPFAQKRWCGAAGVENVATLSDYRSASFGKAYGVLIKELHLLARAVFIIDADNRVRYVQRVEEITNEPDYEDVLAAIRKVAG